MRLVDGKLYISTLSTHQVAGPSAAVGQGSLITRLEGATAVERLLALLLAALIVAASPALLHTVRSTVSLALQILLEAGHAGLIAFHIFGQVG